MPALTRSLLLLLASTLLPGCPDKKLPPSPREEESIPPTPKVDQAFLQQALGPGWTLANRPLVLDIDRRPGTEALVAAHKDNRNHQLAVIRGNHEVLARAPLGGKILANANIQAVAELKPFDLFGDGGKTYLMPVETLVYHQAVCGILAVRYRYHALSLVGEFATRCWRKQSGGHGGDPFGYFKVQREGKQLTVATEEERGKRLYRWSEEQQAFLSSEPLPGK